MISLKKIRYPFLLMESILQLVVRIKDAEYGMWKKALKFFKIIPNNNLRINYNNSKINQFKK